MLSSGTRIGTTRILNWLGEGSCGQSYHCLGSEGEIKGKEFYIKLIPREISERKGFQDYFLQEVQTLEQLDGPGIWPVQCTGVTKWKHWIRYPWLGGTETVVPVVRDDGNEEEKTTELCFIQNLENLCEFEPAEVSPDHLLSIMSCLHQGIYKAHLSGVCHGNIKPSNILVKKSTQGDWEGYVTEFGLYRLNLFTPFGLSEEEKKEVSVMNLDSRSSYLIGESFRPDELKHLEMPEEKWDLFALGKIAQWVMEKTKAKTSTAIDWTEWEDWVSQAIGLDGRQPFETCAHSMDALPKIGDISRFGIKVESNSDDPDVDLEELRLKRELEFKINEKVSTLKTKRGITALVGGISFILFMMYSCYLFLAPSPWTEYSLEGLLDSYQLGAGVFSGQAWGIVPGNYDEGGNGGQDVVGEWSKEDGLFKLRFKRFKKSREEASGKKLWQFIGDGKTSNDDYFIWDDYLQYDRRRDGLLLVKRTDAKHTYVPGVIGNGSPRLYPEERVESSLGEIRKSELLFIKEDKDNIRWSMFFAIGFLLASWLYHRELNKVIISNREMVEKN
jgi:serine/threonine protein kinase